MEKIELNTGIEPISFDIDNASVPAAQEQREYVLQKRAGLNPSADFIGIRTQLAKEEHDEELQQLYQASEDAVMSGADPLKVSEYVSNYQTVHNPDDVGVSLETAVAKKELSEAYQDNELTAANAYNSVFTTDEADTLTKAEIFNGWVADNMNRVENASSFNWWGETFARVAMPFIGAQALDQDVLPFDKDVAFELSPTNTRERQQKFLDDLAINNSPAEYKRKLDAITDYMWNQSGVGPATIQAFVEDMSGTVNKSNDFWGVFEIGTPIIRGINNSIRSAKAAGNTLKAKQEIVDRIKEPEVFLEDGIVNAAKPFQNSQMISYSQKVSDQMAETLADEQAMRMIDKFKSDKVMSDDEIKLYSKLQADELKRELVKDGGDPVDFAAIDTITDESGSTLVAVDIGAGVDGTAAMDEAVAINKALRMGLPQGSFRLVKKDGEGLYIRHVMPLKDRVLTLPEYKEQAVNDWKLMGFGREFSGVAGISAEGHARDIQATRKQTAMAIRLYDTYGKDFNKLSKDSKKKVRNIYLKGQQANDHEGIWWSNEQLVQDFNATDDEVKAYNALHKLSDIEYITKNDNIVQDLNAKGFMLDSQDRIVKEINTTFLDKNYRNMAIKLDDRIVTANDMPLEDIKKTYVDKGYKLIEVHPRSQLQGSLNYTHMLVRAGDYKVTNLPRFITNYAPGGRRAYTYGTAFVKLGRMLKTGGKELNGYARTLIAGSDIKRLRQYASEVNRAIDIAKAHELSGDIAATNRAIAMANFQEFKVDTWEDLKKLVRTNDNPDGVLDLNYKAQVLEDGESYQFMNNLDSAYDGKEYLDDALQDLVDMRGEFSRRRGHILDNINGSQTPILNLDRILDKTIQRAAYNNALGSLHRWYGREFRRNFENVISTKNGYNPKAYSDVELIKTATIDIEAVPREARDIARAAKRMQDHYKLIASVPTKWDKVLSRYMDTAAKALGEKIPALGRDSKALERLSKTDPAKFMRAVGFYAAMGWWNVAQLWKQGLGVLNTFGLDMLNGTRALYAYPFVRLAYRYREGKIVKTLADAAVKLAGITHKQFNDVLRFMDEYGSLDGTKNLVGMDPEHATYLAKSKTLNSMLFFTNAGTNLNYVVADIAAILRAKGKKTFKEIAADADDLYLNMTRASQSAFQAGQHIPTTMFAQWLTYPTRMLETLWHPRLSRAQKISLWTTQLAFWGAAGTLGDDNTSVNMFNGLVEDFDVDPDTAGVITDGLITAMGRELGVEIDEGLGILELIKKNSVVYSYFMEEKTKLPDIPMLQSRGQIASVLYAIQDAVAPETGEYDFVNWLMNRSTDPTAPSSLKNYSRALLAWHTGKFFNTRRDMIKDNTTLRDSVLAAIGMLPSETKEKTYLYEALNDHKKVVEDYYQELKPYVDQIVTYKLSGGLEDPVRRQQELDNIIAKYETELKGRIQLLKETYPDGQKAANELSSRLHQDLFGPINDTDNKRQEVYETLGDGRLQIILKLMRKD